MSAQTDAIEGKPSAFRSSSPLLRLAATVVLVALIFSASVFVWNRLPYAADVQNAFDVHGSPGSAVTGRLFSATVTKVGVAPVVKHTGFFPAQRNIKSVGQWVVVQTTITSLVDAPMANAVLEIGGNGYTPDERLRMSTLGGAQLTPLIPQTGVYVFEVASDVLDHASSGRLYISYGEYKWDSRLVIDIPLDPDHAQRTSVLALSPTVAGQQ